MNVYQQFLHHTWLRRLTVLLSIVLVLWLSRSLMSTILLTFIFSFLVIRLVRFLQRFVPVRANLVVVPVYLIIISGIYYVATHYVPEIAKQSVMLFSQVQSFYNSDHFDNNTLIQWAMQQAEALNPNDQLKMAASTVVAYVGSIGGMLFTTFMALLLSFFYTIDLDGMHSFGHDFLNSDYGWFFQDLKYFADKFINTFGVVMEAQIFIAIVNTVITTVTLMFLHMPNIPSLAVMVFILSLVPVAGAIVSVVPLAIIAYTVGGWQDVITIVVMIIVIHALEAYVLNPKFMSSRTKLPVFFTFVVLLLAEHVWGTWGLIVGLPVFTFFLDILGVKKIPGDKPKPKQSLEEHS